MVSEDAAMEVDKRVKEVVATNKAITIKTPCQGTCIAVAHPKPIVVPDSDSEVEIASGVEIKKKAVLRLTMKCLLNSKFLGFNSKLHHYWETLVCFLCYCTSFCWHFCSANIVWKNSSAMGLSIPIVVDAEVHELHYQMSFMRCRHSSISSCN